MNMRYWGVLWAAVAVSGCYENFGEAIRVTPEADRYIRAGAMAGGIEQPNHILYGAELSGVDYVALRTSPDGEDWSQWSTVQTLGSSDDVGMPSEMNLLADVQDPNKLYAAYSWRDADRNVVVEFARSVNGGGNWSHRAQPWGSQNLKLVQNPETGAIVAAWATSESFRDHNVWVATSVDNGVSFSEPVVAHSMRGPFNGQASYMTLMGATYATQVSGPARLLIAFNWNYDASTPFTVWTVGSDDDGRSWPHLNYLTQAGSSGFGNLGFAKGDIAADGTPNSGRVFVAWYDRTNEDGVIRYMLSEDGGSSYGDEQTLGNTPDNNQTSDGLDLVAGEAGSMLFFYSQGNLYYHELSGEAWAGPRRVNNYVHQGTGVAYRQGGAILGGGNRMIASWADARWTEGDREIAVALSDPSLEEDFSVEIVASSVFDEARRSEAINFDYVVENVGANTQTVDVWVEYRGANGISGTLKSDRLTLDPAEATTLEFSATVARRAPYQSYDLTVYAGPSRNNVLDRDFFRATVVQ